MIVKNQNFKWALTVGRPDLLTDEDRQDWRDLHTLIKTCGVEMDVCEAFQIIEKVLTENSQHLSARHNKYSMFFRSSKDTDKFVKLLEINNPRLIQKLGLV